VVVGVVEGDVEPTPVVVVTAPPVDGLVVVVVVVEVDVVVEAGVVVVVVGGWVVVVVVAFDGAIEMPLVGEPPTPKSDANGLPAAAR